MHAADPRLQHFITACRTGQAQHPPIVSIRWCNLRDGHQHHGSDIGQRGHGRFINVGYVDHDFQSIGNDVVAASHHSVPEEQRRRACEDWPHWGPWGGDPQARQRRYGI
jgi:hypothetical protein